MASGRQGIWPASHLALVSRPNRFDDDPSAPFRPGARRTRPRRRPAGPVAPVAAIGGDAFAVLLPDLAPERAAEVAERMLAALAEAPVQVGGAPLDVSATVGIACHPLHGAGAARLLRCAEIALQQARRQHLPHAVYVADTECESLDNLRLLGDLRHALQHGELELHFQPKVRLRGRHPVPSAQALLRWNHPHRGPVPPALFIPFAEATGFIRTLTEWVLGAAAHELRRWDDEGIPLELAVNISAHDLSRPDFAQLVQRVLDTHRVPAGRLVLELTETGFMADPDGALRTLDALCRMQVGATDGAAATLPRDDAG